MTGSPSQRRLAPLVLKIGISVALVTFVATRVNVTQYGRIFSSLSTATVAAVIAIFIFQMAAISAYRLKTLSSLVGTRVSVVRASAITWPGFFVEQVGAFFVAGDVMRMWLLRRAGASAQAAIEVPLLDRMIGLGSVLSLASYGMLSVWRGMPAADQRAVVVFSVAIVGLIGLAALAVVRGWLGSSRALTALCEAARSVVRALGRRNSYVPLALVVGLALSTHVLNVFCMYLLLGAVGAGVSLADCFLFVPTVLFVAAMPASISGWGLREGAMLVALHAFNVPPAEIVAASVLFGACALVASLPGAAMWLSMPSHRTKTAGASERVVGVRST